MDAILERHLLSVLARRTHHQLYNQMFNRNYGSAYYHQNLDDTYLMEEMNAKISIKFFTILRFYFHLVAKKDTMPNLIFTKALVKWGMEEHDIIMLKDDQSEWGCKKPFERTGTGKKTLTYPLPKLEDLQDRSDKLPVPLQLLIKNEYSYEESGDELFVPFSLAPGGTNRRRRWLPWSFVRRRTSDAAEAAKPSGSDHTGVLFGRPLAALCSQDGSLPQLIQDLLALLQEHGPSTEGIFRLAAGERATRELREALDSGAQVQLESQPVHLLAAILKEFLRKIPSKLLQAELYQDWMSALHNTSRQERLAGLKE
ncbi:hypothetical protein Q9233_013815 [Columba guinea]|nr:hypothetical protein Q9233_013815 [Columba guinea]